MQRLRSTMPLDPLVMTITCSSSGAPGADEVCYSTRCAGTISPVSRMSIRTTRLPSRTKVIVHGRIFRNNCVGDSAKGSARAPRGKSMKRRPPSQVMVAMRLGNVLRAPVGRTRARGLPLSGAKVGVDSGVGDGD